MSLQGNNLNSYEDLLLTQDDKIKKVGIFDKLFKKDPILEKENLDFLDSIKEEKKDEYEDVQDDLDTTQNITTSKNISISITANEKELLLEKIYDRESGLSNKTILLTLAVMLFVLALFIPKIYIRNNIYYTSRNIIQLQTQLDSLTEENKHIKKQLEDIKFNNLTYELDFSSP